MNHPVRIGRFSVSASLLAALLALPCVCQAAGECTDEGDVDQVTGVVTCDTPSIATLRAANQPYEEPDQLCHDRAEGAYQVALAKGDGLPDGEYESEFAFCQWESYRAHLVADPKVSLRELVEFDWTDADDGRLGAWN